MKNPKRHNAPLAEWAHEIDLHLRTIRQLLRRPLEAEIARGGLTGPQRLVMQFVVHFQGRSLKDLSKDVGLSHSTVSGIVDRLEKRGLVERQVDPRDRRISRIVPSKRVRQYVRSTLPKIELNPIVQVLRRAKQEERRAILEGLRTLRRLMEGVAVPRT